MVATMSVSSDLEGSMFRSAFLAASVFAALLASPAYADTIVLEADQWCPYTCEAGSDKPGFMIEVAKAAFEAKGHQVVYRSVPWARALDDVRRTGAAQGAVGATDSDRSESTVFHDEPLGRSANVFVTRAGDSWTFKDLSSLNGRTLGVIKDYTYGSPVDEWIAANGGAVQAVAGDSPLELNLTKLIAGRIDVVVDDAAVIAYEAAKTGVANKLRTAGGTEPASVYIAFSKTGSGPQYAAILSAGIIGLRAGGKLAAILARYGVADWHH